MEWAEVGGGGGSRNSSSEGIFSRSELLSDIGRTCHRLFSVACVPRTQRDTFRRNPAAAELHLASLESQQRRIMGGGKRKLDHGS